MTLDSISLTKPDDWHLHLRDGAALNTTVPHSARCFARAIVMPNLQPPITSVAAALQYRQRIVAAIPAGEKFEPLMTLYLTDNTASEEIARAAAEPSVLAVKYYPAGATTNSENGVTDIGKVDAIIGTMAELGIPLLVHGEVTDPQIDIFDREKAFIDTVLDPLLNRHPSLKLVFEHITTADAVDFVQSQDDRVAATITVHHLLYDRNNLLAGGLRPHFYCLPVLKRSSHRDKLAEAATSGSGKFFLGTDSAPHARSLKETACGCAGIYSAPAALELYAEVFDQFAALDKLEQFASFAGADFYGLPRNTDRIELRRERWDQANGFEFGDDIVVPIRASEPVQWRIVGRQ
ncbi:MAG: dihydroorotase [Gammaproteobacteria bacterium]